MNDPEEFRLLGKRKSSIDNWVLGLPAKYPKLFLFVSPPLETLACAMKVSPDYC